MSPCKILGEKLFVITSRRPRQLSEFANVTVRKNGLLASICSFLSFKVEFEPNIIVNISFLSSGVP